MPILTTPTVAGAPAPESAARTFEFDLQRGRIRADQKGAERILAHLEARAKADAPSNERSSEDAELFLKQAPKRLRPE